MKTWPQILNRILWLSYRYLRFSLILVYARPFQLITNKTQKPIMFQEAGRIPQIDLRIAPEPQPFRKNNILETWWSGTIPVRSIAVFIGWSLLAFTIIAFVVATIALCGPVIGIGAWLWFLFGLSSERYKRHGRRRRY